MAKKKTIAEAQAERASILSGEKDQTSAVATGGTEYPKIFIPPTVGGIPLISKDQEAEGLAAGRQYLFMNNPGYDSDPYVNRTPEPEITADPKIEKPWWQNDPIPESADPGYHTDDPTYGPAWEQPGFTSLLPTFNNDGADKGGDIPGSTPISYSSQYRDMMDAIIRDLQLDKFKFDLNGEELYQQYKDQYLRNGRLAMMDTMGRAAGLTGGYGSTYAQNAGQQAYQGYVNDLNNVVPDVYNAAYTRWRDEQDNKLTAYKLMADADDRDYTRVYNQAKLDEEARQANLKYAADKAQAGASDSAASGVRQPTNTAEINAYKESGKFALDKAGNWVPAIDGMTEDDLSDVALKAVRRMAASPGLTNNNKTVIKAQIMNVLKENYTSKQVAALEEMIDYMLNGG